MGFSAAEAEEMAADVTRLTEWGGAPEHLPNTLSMLARSVWAAFPNSDNMSVPSKGVAAGVPLADVTSGIVASRIARKVRQQLRRHGLLNYGLLYASPSPRDP